LQSVSLPQPVGSVDAGGQPSNNAAPNAISGKDFVI
jgi:hypothetical protein